MSELGPLPIFSTLFQLTNGKAAAAAAAAAADDDSSWQNWENFCLATGSARKLRKYSSFSMVARLFTTVSIEIIRPAWAALSPLRQSKSQHPSGSKPKANCPKGIPSVVKWQHGLLSNLLETGSVNARVYVCDCAPKKFGHTQMAKCKLCHKQRSDPEEFLRYEHN